MSNHFLIRDARTNDIPSILFFIKELAIYEKMLDEVIVTEEMLYEELFIKESAYCVLAFENEIPIGFALYFFNFSTFKGRQGLYLEDLYIKPEFRGKGYGKHMFLHLKEIANDHNCARMEWSVLDWNSPAIDFYKSIGAIPMDEWTVYRLVL